MDMGMCCSPSGDRELKQSFDAVKNVVVLVTLSVSQPSLTNCGLDCFALRWVGFYEALCSVSIV